MKSVSTSDCKETPSRVRPIVDLNKCEAKGPCVEKCPYDVFEIKPISKEDRSSLSFTGKLKTLVHGPNKAFVVKPDMCHACGLCVTACPEDAIKLRKLLAISI
jgi:4Fe-4S ferredoxin